MKIAICTPIQNRQVGCAHHESSWPLMRDPSFTFIPSKFTVDDDLVRARSRCVYHFLNETNADAILMWDADIEGSREALRGMIDADVDCIGSTYPKKKLDEWGRCTDFAMRAPNGAKRQGQQASVEAIGMGFMLLRRPLLERMVKDFAETLTDEAEDVPIVMLFALQWAKRQRRNGSFYRVLDPEDFSFCGRVWRGYGDVWLYCGPGAPVAHEGHHVYRARPEDLGPMPMPIQAPPATYVDEAGVERVWGDDRP